MAVPLKYIFLNPTPASRFPALAPSDSRSRYPDNKTVPSSTHQNVYSDAMRIQICRMIVNIYKGAQNSRTGVLAFSSYNRSHHKSLPRNWPQNWVILGLKYHSVPRFKVCLSGLPVLYEIQRISGLLR